MLIQCDASQLQTNSCTATAMNIYIVEEGTWDHHENIAIFSSKEKAVVFCDTNYQKINEEQWKTCSYNYWISEYIVGADPV
jgi:hypothetical protein